MGLPSLRMQPVVCSSSPIKIFEHLASGKPIVASNLTSINRILTNEIDSILVDPNSISSFKNAILKLLNNENLYRSISSNAMNKANTQSWQIRAKNDFEKFANPTSIIWQEVETDYWKQFLKDSIKEFETFTFSQKANKILKNFEEELKNFKQVCPIEMLDKLDNPISSKPHIKKAG